MERQLPGPIPIDEFEATINEFGDYIGADWLSAQPPDASPLTEIWNRTDYLASLELYTVADSYKQMAGRTDSGWLAEYKKAIKTHDARKIVSATYELVSAAMFSYEQEVMLPPASNPGYDFTVSHSGKTVRVSCKKIGVSKGEKAFRKQAEQLYEYVRIKSAELGTPSFQMVLGMVDTAERLKLTLAELRSGILYQLTTYKAGHTVQQKLGGWRLGLIPIYYGHSDLPIDREYPSHEFICFAPHSQNEQQRCLDRFKEAARKLKKCELPIDDDNVNLVMMRLPPAVSFDQASKWLNAKFSCKDFTTVAAVIFHRPILASALNLSSTLLRHEVALVTNPNAKVTWEKFVPRGLKYNLKLPIGTVSQAESYDAVSFGGKPIKLKDKYMFQRGQVNLKAGPRGKEMRLSISAAPGIKHTIVERLPGQGAVGIQIVTPPDNTLTLL